MTDPNKPVSEITVREMFALEIASHLHGMTDEDRGYGYSAVASKAVERADQLIKELNEKG